MSRPSLLTPKKFSIGAPRRAGQRVGIYGTGGIGKTSLAARCPGRKAFFDLDESMDRLKLSDVVQGVETWQDIRDALASIDDVDTIVIDSVTRAEELAVAHTLKHTPTEKGTFPTSIEGYGYGKGFQHVFDTFLPLLADLDAHARAGRNIVLVMHECFASVPNPQGEDYIRYEPRLQSPGSGKASIRYRIKEWLDHLLFIGYDVDVRDNKARGSGTRTIYPLEMPHCMAKTRSLTETIDYEPGSTELWNRLGIDTATQNKEN